MNKEFRPRQFTAKQSARLGAYLATGVASSMIVPSDVEAAIVYFNVNPDQTINAGQSIIFGDIGFGPATYNLGDTDAPSFMLKLTGAGSDPYNGYGGTTIEWGLNPASEVLKLAFGATINAGAAFSWDGSYNYLTKNGSGPWVGGANAYAALRFDSGGGNFQYGWVNIDYGTSPSPYATITGFAFEDQVNTSIAAGATAPIPEPGAWVALAVFAGGAAFARWRQRRNEAQKDAA